MTTIKEDYVSFETAKLLKEKGFSEVECQNSPHFAYNMDGQFSGPSWDTKYNAPTLQMAMKWLREVHNIHIVIKIVIRTYGDIEYYYELYGTKNKSLCVVCDIYKGETWSRSEQACEEAIKYCLEYLI